VIFILVGVVLLGVDRRGVVVGVCFRVFRLYTAHVLVLSVTPVSVCLVQRPGY